MMKNSNIRSLINTMRPHLDHLQRINMEARLRPRRQQKKKRKSPNLGSTEA
jgi:hypothetical protein